MRSADSAVPLSSNADVAGEIEHHTFGAEAECKIELDIALWRLEGRTSLPDMADALTAQTFERRVAV